MPGLHTILRRRRARLTRARAARRGPLLLAGLTAGAAVLAGILVTATAVSLSALTEGLPAVETIERRFTTAGVPDFATTRLFDREGSLLLAEAVHPRAGERRWLHIDRSALERPQVDFLRALLAYQGAGFLTDPGYDGQALLAAAFGGAPRPTITEQLARAALTPLSDVNRSPMTQRMRTAMQAGELTRRYPKEQILEWYVNSADFGHLAYGVDAAALVYFGKHANDLTLAESAVLAGIPGRPEDNPFDRPLEARTRQLEVLLTMQARGWINRAQLEAAQQETLALVDAGAGEFPAEPALVSAAWNQLQQLWGTGMTSRPGLKIITSMDNDLQAQAACTAASHLERLSGESRSAVAPASSGACVAAGLLPPLRPSASDAGSQAPQSAAVVVLDAATGQVLALVGDADTPHFAGMSLAPVAYLTAFSRGYSPASMLIVSAPAAADDPTPLAGEEDDASYGMMRMRTALANGFRRAAEQTWTLAGVSNVLRTARQMGIDVETAEGSDVSPQEVRATLLDLTQAYALFDSLGRGTGLAGTGEASGEGLPALAPATLLQLEDPATGEIYSPAKDTRTVLSAQLAYLVTDILSDEEARWPNYHQGNALEIGRPAGVQAGSSSQGGDNWAIGFTPETVIGVWVGNADGVISLGRDDLAGAAPIWHALMRYAVREVEPSGWVVPPGIETVEVCDPSGLLPTEYCPQIVKEVFLSGAAPMQYDNIYRPFRINRETGKLATLSTPLDLVEEQVFLIPPPEAEAWAEQIGIPRPPVEYDTVAAADPATAGVAIHAPLPFAYVRGKVTVTGSAALTGQTVYRLQAGQGLNPDRWILIGGDTPSTVEEGVLGTWDTGEINGLYTLQLTAVRQDGQLETAAVQVSVDNSPPEIEILSPAGDEAALRLGEHIVLQVEASDNLGLSNVELLLNGSPIEQASRPPYSLRWAPASAGRFEFSARATDLAGNVRQAGPVVITVAP